MASVIDKFTRTGQLCVEGVEHDVRYAPLQFDGWHERHWTLPFSGERYSLVWFTPAEAGARFELPEPPAGTRWVSVLGDEGEDQGASVRVPGLFGRVWSART